MIFSGVESIHHKIKRIAHRYEGMRVPEERMKSTIEDHHLSSMPEITTLMPPTKVRRKKQETEKA